MEPALALPPGWRLERRILVDSTNDEAAALAREGAPHGTIVWAESQRRGRGRRGRSWESPPGNLHCTTLLRFDRPLAIAGQMTFVAALALLSALDRWLPGERVSLKWPNDLLADGRKISGILLESAATADGAVDWVIVGTGVNIRHHPAAASYPTIALADLIAVPPTVAEVLSAYLAGLQRWFAIWLAEGFDPVRAAWLDRALGVGQAVRVNLAGRSLDGRFDSLDGDGALLLAGPGGAIARVTAGDVFFGAA